MVPRRTRDELFPITYPCLCLEGHSDDLDLAMLDAEKAARVGQLVYEGMLADGDFRDDDLELLRQTLVAVSHVVKRATDAYWKAQEAPKPGDAPPPTADNVVPLAKKGSAAEGR
jgi:hypothetical protein